MRLQVASRRQPIVVLLSLLLFAVHGPTKVCGSTPTRARQGMVVSQDHVASRVGVDILRQGGNAMDAAVATAFALAVTHPAAGNIGGGGFLVYCDADANAATYDFREVAPQAATAEMWLVDGRYSPKRHHASHLAVGVPGTVAGLHLAWQDEGSLPWATLLAPAIELAEEGFVISETLAESLRGVLDRMREYPASLAQFSRDGTPYAPGERLVQRDLATTLRRIAEAGPDGFYRGATADLIVAEMRAHEGLITHQDLVNYQARKRTPLRAQYRDYEIIAMPPPSSGGVALIEMLNILEPYDLRAAGFGSARTIHWYAEAMRRAFADRARFLGDPDFNPDMPVARLTSREHADQLRQTIAEQRASVSDPDSFAWPPESTETTHLSVVDQDRSAVALTYTLEYSYGSAIVVPGGGFLLNNEMGDFNAAAGLTTRNGLIGTPPNLTAPGKRMLSSMSPTIVLHNQRPVIVTGSPGGTHDYQYCPADHH